jgi:hypothetical protein
MSLSLALVTIEHFRENFYLLVKQIRHCKAFLVFSLKCICRAVRYKGLVVLLPENKY